MPDISPEHAQALLRYIARRYGRDEMANRSIIAAIERDSFERQRRFIRDDGRVVACGTGRRGGKTVSVERKLFRRGLRAPNNYSCYIALTRKNAKLLLWPELLELNRRYKIGGVPNIADLTLTLPNGHIIWLGGAETAGEIDKYRSFRYTTAAIDEAGTFGPWLKPLVEDVLEPATIETKGQILLCGTPGPVCEGYFYDVTANPETIDRHISLHKWTLLNNPFIHDARKELDRIIKARGWGADHPTLLREYYGEWVADHTALVYHYDPAMLWDGALPESRYPWEHTLSVDVGYHDATAFCLLAYNRENPDAWVRKCWKQTQLEPHQIADKIDEVCRGFHVVRVVADVSGGLASGQLLEWQRRFRIPFHMPPKKNMKQQHIALMNDDARAGKLHIHRDACADLMREMQTVCWDEARKSPDPKYANDCTDALEYGWASSLHYAAKEPPPARGPIPDEVRFDREEAAIEQRMQRERRRRNRLRP